MLPPHELKNKVFTRAMRGYNPVEVDEYVEFMIEKYTELYRENDELERKLKSTTAKLDEIRGEEDSIRSALIEAKRTSAQIIADAEQQADMIIRSAKTSCNSILANFNTKIEEGHETLVALKSDAVLLRQELFARYSEHIEAIRELTDGIDMSDIPDTDELRRQAITSLKESIVNASAKTAAAAEPTQTEAADDVADAQPDSAEQSDVEVESAQDDEENITFTPSDSQPEAASEEAPVGENETQVFDTVSAQEKSDDQSLTVERSPVSKSTRSGIKSSVLELNKRYKAEDEVVSTPDSDSEDESNYLDFVMSVTGKDPKFDAKKEEELDLLFSDPKSGKKKK